MSPKPNRAPRRAHSSVAARHRAPIARIAALVAPLLALLAGCGASDGGPIGSGITASVVGNVLEVSSAASQALPAAGDVGAISVSIAGVPGAAATTDAAGNFHLTGAFSGGVRLEFRTSEFSVGQDLLVPAGSTVALSDIVLTPARVEVGSARQLGFIATVAAVDCGAGRLTVRDLGEASAAIEVALRTDTTYEASDGAAAACADVRVGGRVGIDGLIPGLAAGTDAAPGVDVVALRVVLRPATSGGELERTTPFAGYAIATDCANWSILLSQDEGGTVRLALTDHTAIVAPGDARVACEDVRVGDRLTGLGVLALDAPGELRATSLVVGAAADGGVKLFFFGRLASIDCATGALRLVFERTVTVVRLASDTEVTPAYACADLHLGDHVAGVGSVDGSGGIVALRMRVRRD